ncbi:MAG: pirin family protein, partial [Spirochaetia bacterium]|nr:pirin family protein [Spirochaetia bacterium]
MPSLRRILSIHPARMVDMGGILIRQPLPGPGLDQCDPFLLLHHGDIKIARDMEPRHAGVGPHPHRGFSPVTFIFKGGVHHRDSRGNDSVVYAGGVQWMNAGMGLIHSERPPDDIQSLGGQMEILQLWVNTPSRNKMDIPEYFPLQKSDIPVLDAGDPKITASLVAGTMLGKTGPMTPLLKNKIEVTALVLEMNAQGEITVPIPAGHNACVYLLDGEADFGNGAVVFG